MPNGHAAHPVAGAVPPPNWWDHVLDLFLTLWVLRVPFGGVLVGFALLCLAPQAQDLLVERALSGLLEIAWFPLLVTFIWAMPTHYAARILIEADTRYRDRMAERGTWFIERLSICTPRVLGTLTYVAMIGGVYRSWLNLPDAGPKGFIAGIELWLLVLAILLAIMAAVFFAYTVYRDQIASWWIFVRAEWLAASIMAIPRAAVADILLPPTRTRGGAPISSSLGPLLLLLMFLALTVLPIIFPLTFAYLFPRASAVAFIVGGWIPLLAYLSGVGRRARAPFITIAIAATILLPLVVGNNYGVRLIDAAKTVSALVPGTSADSRQITTGVNLKDAIAWWRQANSCPGDAKCPRPIIVAAAGGASRAGFFTASVIGQLLDDRMVLDGAGHGLSAADMNNRLFAISSVSGSSVGAVMAVAALAKSEKGAPPCKAGAVMPLWFGFQTKQKIDDWRSCLEAMMSGDFLTPVMAGFVFRDVLRFFHVVFPWPDRAALIEMSWENQFADLVGKPQKGPGNLLCTGSLLCPFMTLRPSREKWVPLLVLNGTSVGSGQRIVTTVLDSRYEAQEACPLDSRTQPCQLFTDGFDFHGLVSGQDVRLSTAAHNSARFPFISPPGEIISGGKVADRIVDGGYFENYGAQSARELAQAIRAIDKNLNPFVLVLSNDPQVPRKPDEPRAQASYGSEGNFFTDLSGPIKAIMNTRNARGTLAVDDLRSELDAGNTATCNVAQILVWGEDERDWFGRPRKGSGKPRELSMSWWLSKPVQMFLHEQTVFEDAKSYGARNREPARHVLDALIGNPAAAAGPGHAQCSQPD